MGGKKLICHSESQWKSDKQNSTLAEILNCETNLLPKLLSYSPQENTCITPSLPQLISLSFSPLALKSSPPQLVTTALPQSIPHTYPSCTPSNECTGVLLDNPIPQSHTRTVRSDPHVATRLPSGKVVKFIIHPL